MNELIIQILQELASLSGIALFIGGGALFGLLVYKLLIVGSIYGLLKFIVSAISDRVKEYFVRPINRTEVVKVVEAGTDGVGDKLFVAKEVFGSFLLAIRRLNALDRERYIYIHQSDIDALNKAIDIMEANPTNK